MLSDGVYVDGSWELKVFVEDIQLETKIRVKGDLHIGGAMHQLVESLRYKQDWSDHAFWWPDRNAWLTRTRTTLDQYSVQSDASLVFMKMHNDVRLTLPSLATAVVRVNFANNIFAVVMRICKELNIRHSEELSLLFPLKKEDLKQNNPLPTIRRRYQQPNQGATCPDNPGTPGPFSPPPALTPTVGFGDTMSPSPLLPRSGAGTLGHGTHLAVPTPLGKASSGSTNLLPTHSVNSLFFDGADESKYTTCSYIPAKNVFGDQWLIKPKSLVQKARLNATWLDSSRSLMELGVRPMGSSNATVDHQPGSSSCPSINLRFKFYSFYDLNVKYDTVRLHQLYEQARWSILAEHFECTEDEMVVFAALQLQAELQTDNPQNSSGSPDSVDQTAPQSSQQPPEPVDEVDEMLTELEMNCLGSSQRQNGANSATDGDTTVVPELANYVKVSKEKMLGIKSYKRHWLIIRETQLILCKSHDDTTNVVEEYSLRGSEPVPEVNVATNKYVLRLSISLGYESKVELWLRFSSRDDYARWMAAFRLISRGKTLASTVMYDKEVESILDVLKLQTPGPQPALSAAEIAGKMKDLLDYISERILRKAKSKDHLRHRIAEAHSNIRDLNLLDAKLKYVRTWQALTGFGITHFVVRFDKQKKEEVIGISHNRIMLLHHSSGEAVKTWHFGDMRSWHINWDAEKIVLDFKQEKVVFTPLSANCKAVIEFIGGYVFLSQRTPEKNQDLDVNLFHRLTGLTNAS